jgi:hypothetical protein
VIVVLVCKVVGIKKTDCLGWSLWNTRLGFFLRRKDGIGSEEQDRKGEGVFFDDRVGGRVGGGVGAGREG